MHHFRPEEAVPDFAAGPDAASDFHLLLLAAVKIDEAHHQLMSGLVGKGDYQLLARLELHFAAGDDAFDLRRMAKTRGSFTNRDDLGFVFVARRQVKHEIHAAAQTEFGESCTQFPGLFCAGSVFFSAAGALSLSAAAVAYSGFCLGVGIIRLKNDSKA